jgi:hypothetical protein
MKDTTRILIILIAIAVCHPMLASDSKAPAATAAAANTICPVSGNPVGGDLGPPVAVTFKGRLIWVCCKTCARKFYANPEKYIAILDQSASRK